MKIGKILVPHDGSKNADRAFEYALDIAKKYNSKVLVASCILVQNQLPEYSTIEEETILERQREAASRLVEILELRAADAEVSFKGVILKTSSVSDAILSYAEKNNVDIIVSGSRGLGGFKRLVLGSVASSLVQYAKCPVLIVK
ncbi:UspA domain protein [Nitrosotalea sinensis]|uniref:UspA domain protein n=1 Tax=Nitrosotalea sinensis TaxID=1499975 RepID=A0A2H1EEA8_9ARCH|nr:universal stress protein [Candidatus Nitrosotalea sinensis]SHO42792.1 UspA domain protein [Candidatus Nitrosotalea sinensis]